jgi:hypothetical protein
VPRTAGTVNACGIFVRIHLGGENSTRKIEDNINMDLR